MKPKGETRGPRVTGHLLLRHASSFTFLSIFCPVRQMDALLKSWLMKLLMREEPAEGLSESSHGR